MSKPSPSQHLTTVGLTPFSILHDQALFRVNAGVPLHAALSHASDLLHLAKMLAEDAAMEHKTDRYAWASHYLQDMCKAVIDDAAKVLANRNH
ncbi:Protein of unknown function [Pseudomonas sp. ok272]|uniref:DUF3077 domain-containing protein n=1 Tax=unclassified Pseudomonas TaxID=196821 RepID=UPI0008C39F94|nr:MULTISPECIES: DUF3077 domain-containing protein [unclassified Pseudomonas]SEM95819.1 Protein of unknown function [Pseudomonas sp. ok272]SFM92573.1 Protein of unknown function [Pseudomonas sp. ok602]